MENRSVVSALLRGLNEIGDLIRCDIWREIDDFSSGSVCLVLASEYFNEDDYYREYADFLQAVRGQAQ